MADPEPTVILEHLEHIRGAVDHIDSKLSRFDVRISTLEFDFVALAKAEATRNIDVTAIVKQVARLEDRVKSLESQRIGAPKPQPSGSAVKPPRKP